MISAPNINRWAGPIIDVLLDYVGHVTLCSRLMEHLNSYPDWSVIKEKAGESVTDNEPIIDQCGKRAWSYPFAWFPAAPPRPLLHLCRIQIVQLAGLRRLDRLPLPGSLIRFLKHQQAAEEEDEDEAEGS